MTHNIAKNRCTTGLFRSQIGRFGGGSRHLQGRVQRREEPTLCSGGGWSGSLSVAYTFNPPTDGVPGVPGPIVGAGLPGILFAGGGPAPIKIKGAMSAFGP